MNRKSVPINGQALRRKALDLHEHMLKKQDKEGTQEEAKPFIASSGWLYRVKNRLNLKSIKVTGESASADYAAAASFPAELKRIIADGSYHPKQVFNCDETALFWKRMPNRTYIHKSAKRAPGFKAFKDRVTLVLCGNAAGHTIKPGLVYRAKNPRAIKNKNKKHLPVFWQHNRNAWVTALLFTEWFHQCFIPEVKKYLQEQGLAFKVLLRIDNAPSHPDSIAHENENVHVVFLPANTTSLLQPLDQGVTHCVKAI
ncbi:hypothetical protein M513_12361 [Trichuris suis]|uniref:HTH CENPB-type domain-containing protein n=1 Tax=Trichuris suis TaxID=68888 RepID=A0A085LP84_9BILA|nr:hypothetical protein M513_12361 [Trichuris suis]